MSARERHTRGQDAAERQEGKAGIPKGRGECHGNKDVPQKGGCKWKRDQKSFVSPGKLLN